MALSLAPLPVLLPLVLIVQRSGRSVSLRQELHNS